MTRLSPEDDYGQDAERKLVEALIAARDAGIKAHDEGRTLVFPDGVTVEEAKRLRDEFRANGGGNVQVSGLSKEVFVWLMRDNMDRQRKARGISNAL